MRKINTTKTCAAAASAAILGLLGACDTTTQTASPMFHEPPEFVDVNGVTAGRLEAAVTEVEIGERKINTIVFNELYAPPTIRVRPGDEIDLNLTNDLVDLGQPTNIHFHGMQVSPLGDSDNIFRQVQPGTTARYHVAIPADHERGMYWYHSHANRFAEWQVFGGLSGGIIVEGILDPFPELQGITERVMLLKNIRSSHDASLPNSIITSDPSIHSINGQVNPTITIAPGETQFWRIGNVGPNQYYRLRLEGHEFYELARDGNLKSKLVPKSELIIPPSSRLEVLVRGGAPGSYALEMLITNTGPLGDTYNNARNRLNSSNPRLATLVSEGPAVEPIVLPTKLREVRDLRKEPVARKRDIVFTESADGNTFFINGNKFDIDVTNTYAKLGDVEEWTIRNASDELHVFHIHQLDFQVTEVNGEPVEFTGHQDTVNTPINGEVKVLIPFTDPVVLGKFVYHCHIMEHEDAGMMAVIQVSDDKQSASGAANGSLFGPKDICAYLQRDEEDPS
ncbi:MAG TPA: multicopper oxidase family protein [Kiloniellaceae bacterium]|nr:multicopper oxidase family protein [Kiloniellaceae bacterium]